MSDDPSARSTFADLPIIGLLAELAGGIIIGLGLAWAGGRLGALVGRGGQQEFADLVGAVLGIFMGYIVGVPLGIALAGRLVGRRGSFWLAVAGSIIGGVLVALLAEPLRLNASTRTLSFALFFVVLAMAVLGFNLHVGRRR